jgi:DNA-binding transcriptional ArsR family regulator
VLRILFTSEDLGRIRLAGYVDPLWEIAGSVCMLRRRDGVLPFGAWRHRVGATLPPAAQMLLPLLPPYGYFPDFLTPVHDGAGELEPAVDTVLRTSRGRLRTDLARLAAERRRPPGWLHALAAGVPHMLEDLGTALRAYHQTALAPYGEAIQARIDADRVARAHAVLNGGVDGLLASLGPAFRWRPPVLEADYPVARELRLAGRGLLLQPSAFCWRTPVTFYDDDFPPVLVYPALHGVGSVPPLVEPPVRGDHPLAALIGRTRAALLDAVETGRSTGELARTLRVSTPTVSQHIGILRDAGLLLTTRRANRVLHTITPAGHALRLAAQHPTAVAVGRERATEPVRQPTGGGS